MNAIVRGDALHSPDGRKIRLSNIGPGIQLLVEDTYDEPSWEGWDVPISKPRELTYSERIKAVPCHAAGRPDYNRDYWERKEIL
ncbi:hypothetical protein L4D76_13055 [Photobacterium sagamiensis]|uniref:hypothetical protein n=1 Tax=Photobacterium sagamiensis TaxID=2910241 RepID=UPI003D0A2A22